MSIASRVAGMMRLRNLPGPMFGSSPAVGQPYPPMGPLARIAVEIAFSASANTSPSTWNWIDVTADVRQADGINTSVGRSDEASTSQPATCTFTLDNTSRNYGQGTQSIYYPVRQGCPVRVRMSLDGVTFSVVFQGFAAGFTPSWHLTGDVRTTVVEASGTLRRLIQGSAPLLSSFRRAYSTKSGVVGYWPMEDGPRSASLAPVVGFNSMAISGYPKLADNTAFECSAPVITINQATLSAEVPAFTSTGVNVVRCLFSFPSAEQTNGSTILRVFTSGVLARTDLIYGTGGTLQMIGYDRFNTALFTSSVFSYNVLNRNFRASVELSQVAGDVSWSFGLYGENELAQYNSAGTLVGSTVGNVVRVQIGPGFGDVGVGHLTVENVYASQFADRDYLNSYNGEVPYTRIQRLAAQNNLQVLNFGNGDSTYSATDAMGPQTVANLVDTLRETELAAQGLVFDGMSEGIAYVTHRARENLNPALTINAAAFQLADPFQPTDDDQRTVNKSTVTRTGGSFATFEDTASTAAIGTYDSSATVNCSIDSLAVQYASWFVSLGTVQGYRYPAVSLDLLATPSLAAQWLAVRPGSKIIITGLQTVLPGHPTDSVELMVEGTSQTITAATWTATAKCSPYDVWRVGTASATTGDTGTYVLRGLSSGSNLAAAIAPGTTSISVATPTGPLWTTDADDYPMTLSVGGDAYVASACSGASSPQTFTIAAATKNYPAGAEVTLYQPPGLGL